MTPFMLYVVGQSANPVRSLEQVPDWARRKLLAGQIDPRNLSGAIQMPAGTLLQGEVVAVGGHPHPVRLPVLTVSGPVKTFETVYLMQPGDLCRIDGELFYTAARSGR